MKIESVEVIPMRGESIWEDTENPFEVMAISTSFDEWKKQMIIEHQREKEDHYYNPNDPYHSITFDSDCMDFAENQFAYMLAPTGKFGSDVYISKTISVKTLDVFKLDGPLYKIRKTEDGEYQIRFGVLMER